MLHIVMDLTVYEEGGGPLERTFWQEFQEE